MVTYFGEEVTENWPRRPSVGILEDMFTSKGLLVIVQFHVFFVLLFKGIYCYGYTLADSCSLLK